MKKSITLALIIGLSPFCQAQESNNDISVKFSQSFNRLNESKFGLEYRRSVSENFKVKLVDYGFLWGHIYDEGGFDDFTWWLFEK